MSRESSAVVADCGMGRQPPPLDIRGSGGYRRGGASATQASAAADPVAELRSRRRQRRWATVGCGLLGAFREGSSPSCVGFPRRLVSPQSLETWRCFELAHSPRYSGPDGTPIALIICPMYQAHKGKGANAALVG